MSLCSETRLGLHEVLAPLGAAGRSFEVRLRQYWRAGWPRACSLDGVTRRTRCSLHSTAPVYNAVRTASQPRFLCMNDVSQAPRPLVRLAVGVNRVVQYLSRDAFGGPRVLKLAWVINLQKGGTIPFIAVLMWWYGNTSTAAWVYLGLHGGYGLSWLVKDLAVPDRGWQQRVTFGGALLSFLLVLAPYWVLPWLLISGALGPDHPQPAPALMAACVVLFTIGLTLMIGADAQKNAALAARTGLVTTGFYARMRHPNYLGEMLIFASFALMVRHWIPWAILGAIWTVVFMTNIAAQEVSLSRHAGWPAYIRRTGLLFPRRRRPRRGA